MDCPWCLQLTGPQRKRSKAFHSTRRVMRKMVSQRLRPLTENFRVLARQAVWDSQVFGVYVGPAEYKDYLILKSRACELFSFGLKSIASQKAPKISAIIPNSHRIGATRPNTSATRASFSIAIRD